jgi:predicted kinase
MVCNPRAQFPLAQQLRSPEGAPLGELFSFVSGLYFRGKATYAETFGRPPPELAGGLVISAGEGLRFLHERVTLDRVRLWSEVDIDERNRRFTEPLIAHAEALERAYGATARFVLLGSVATDKYVGPLARVFGDHLLFPPEFVGRGDMSRGALMLKAARMGRELSYLPVEDARRHGPRAPSVARRRQDEKEVAVLVGLPGAGKSTFAAQRFADTHVHVSKDDLRNNGRPARRQQQLIEEALAAGRSVVVDNTNASVGERADILASARRHGARVVGYFFDCTARDCLARNAGRQGRARVPNVGVFATAKRLTPPSRGEGFDDLYVVRCLPGPEFDVVSAG